MKNFTTKLIKLYVDIKRSFQVAFGTTYSPTGGTRQYFVVASNAPAIVQLTANYLCTGSGDDVQIQAAIEALGTVGGEIQLSEGTFTISNAISITNSYINVRGRGIGSTFITTKVGSNANGFNITGTGVIHVSIKLMQIDCNKANNTYGSGIHINTPWQTYDAEHVFEDLLITNTSNNGVEAAQYADTRAMFFSRVHVKGVSGNGFYFPWPSITDCIFEDCIADTVALNGFYQGGANCHHSNCKMFYCGSAGGLNMGFYIAGYNNYFVNCEAQDNYQGGFYSQNDGDPTYGTQYCTLVNCVADSNNQNSNASYGCGLQLIGVTGWQIIGGIYFVRPYASFTQRIGISLQSGTKKTIIIGAILVGNTTNYSDSSTGPNYPALNDGAPPSYFAGTLSLPYRAVSATASVSNTDYVVECTANTFTVTLPTSVGAAGNIYIIKNSGSGTITVATTSSQTIDGSTTVTLTQYQQLRVMSNGANWIVI